ncbi:alpha-1,2-fucosyltransferase [Spirosoma sp. 209]|uniref:alpha-1,2-fucosyltransferase n=1 Tax=Spirosoma sp. 209 TaxID=1955701 RepID=UPI00098D5DFD|nr:alpha-1,2-fucosyltransferase [Spirosoma sp. 209]
MRASGKISHTIEKARRRLWGKTVSWLRHKPCYPYIYKSYWHYRFNSVQPPDSDKQQYYTAVPNRGAGIGHQMANWIAGYWFAGLFDLKFAHIPFSNDKWESLLGFGENEILAADLLTRKGFKQVRLPLFDEGSAREISLTRHIISSYADQNVLFVAEQDQFYTEQYGVQNALKEKFYAAKARQKDELLYDSNNFNIAIHVRRGDIVTGQENNNPNLLMRWQDADYFEKVLFNVINSIQVNKPIKVFLFSQGDKKEFSKFEDISNINFCLDMGAQESFLHMVHADLLITSKSSFSYKPALLSNGIKICPRNFWHGYPRTNDWILTEEDGSFDINLLAIRS